MILPLSESASVTLDGSGNGRVRVGPDAHGVKWLPTVVGLAVRPAVNSPQCNIYAGKNVTDANFVDGTYTGEKNSSDAIAGQELWLGQYVWAVWTAGDPGANATVTVTGTKDV